MKKKSDSGDQKEKVYHQLLLEHKQNLDLLIASEIRYRRLFESAQDGILILDAETGMIVDVNPFLMMLLDYSKEQFIQKAIWEIGVFNDVIANYDKFLELQQKGYVRYENLPLKTSSGKVIHVEFVSNVYLVNESRVIQCNIRDISRRILADEALIKAKDLAEENDRLKTAFLHNISHEIRTPMNAIIGFSEMLNEPDLTDQKRVHFTGIIIQSSNQLLSIISDIVSIATIEAGQEKVFHNEINIRTFLKSLQEQFGFKASRLNLNLIQEPTISDNEIWFLSDETKLNQILSNLIINALKFTSKGHVRFGVDILGQELRFFVEDTGLGIPSQMHVEIFKRFRQVESTASRKYGGSGLGLSISKAYVELLGGTMWLSSEINNGSTFYFTIPLVVAHQPAGEEHEPADKNMVQNHERKTLLVAEDEDSNFTLLEEFLSGLNFNIIRAITGIEAIENCKTNRKIDLILMDIKMPEMDGCEAAQVIRKFLPDIPIIAQTAFFSELDKTRALACGCSDYISKPIKRQQLIDKIKAQLVKASN